MKSHPRAASLFLILFCVSGCRRAPEAALPTTRTRSSQAVSVAQSASASPPFFADRAESAGLDYRWVIAGKRPLNILQSIGNGCAFLDFDGDGNLDILLIGSPLALYRGDGKGRFTDVTKAAGLDKLHGHFLGCAVGDYDNDGYPDIYISAHQGGVLLHNEAGVGTSHKPKIKRQNAASRVFRDVTKQAGLAAQPWGASCAFVDVDGDGRLDLYIGNYVLFGPNTKPQLCDMHSILTSCGPGEYAAAKGVLYHNLGGGRFQDVTRAWGFDTVSGKALGVAAAPFDSVGQRALAIANDQVPGDFLVLHGARSKNRGIASGMAYAGDGRVYGGMGLDWGDYDNDGQLDLVIATYQNQAKPVFHNENGAFVVQDTAKLGMFSSLPRVAFGVKWLDVDNDGWLDLLFANGHVQDNIANVDLFGRTNGGAIYRQPMTFYRNLRGQKFQDESARLGSAQRPIVGRGLAVGDYDNDGKIDALAVDSEGRPILLHNETPNAGHWLLVKLVGTRSNRDGFGALVIVQAGGVKRVRHCGTDGSYLSASDARVHIGLGTATKATLTVRWPSGHTDTYPAVKSDRIVTLREKR